MRIFALTGLVLFVCFSVTFGTFLIVKLITFVLPFSLTQFRIVMDALRAVLAVGLAYSWLHVWKRVTDLYFWRSVRAYDRSRQSMTT